MTTNRASNTETSRRDFLKLSGGAVAASALAGVAIPRVHAVGSDTIKVALIGCGGRGTGAASNALSTQSGPVKLHAMADVFEDRLQKSLDGLKKKHKEKVEVPKDRQFVGFDAYKKAMDTLGPEDVVLLTTPPAFRPLHLEYAVQKGLHVFMEKAFAVDAPGIRRVLKAGEEARKKNLKIAGGLMSRHSKPLEAAIEQIHKGAIGDIITCWAYRVHGPVGFQPKAANMSELMHQIRNYSCFTWLNGSFILDWLIHNLDVCCWVKNAWPVSAQGQGGRQTRTEPDQLFDHYAVEYHFPDGTRLFAQGRHIAKCWGFFGCIIHGTRGSGVLGEGISQPRLFKDHKQTAGNQIWEFKGTSVAPHQAEHDLLFEAIRQNKPYNETERSAYAAMTGILGRMAAESGQLITWEQAMASNLELAPGREKLPADSQPPVMPDANGRYPIAMPGTTQVL
ncbi:MAG: Gfo/Idh/MocA family oxidoreductase [Verrucomicrobiae bacterium]|nr:Gfo/Idh/MocA family oxidoreductase [Verrucomicrobiae bacterium]